MNYQGRVLGAREDSLFYHLVKRVLLDEQWAEGTTVDRFLADLRAAVRSTEARLVIYADWGGPVAATITPTSVIVPATRRSRQSQPNLLVIYSADRGMLVSGYQSSTLGKTRIPQEALWLK